MILGFSKKSTFLKIDTVQFDQATQSRCKGFYDYFLQKNFLKKFGFYGYFDVNTPLLRGGSSIIN
jgi:hypothetical protein